MTDRRRNLYFFLFVFLGGLFSIESYGAITFLRASGYSRIATSPTAPIIYAGFAENGSTCEKDGINTCNTCAGAISGQNRLPCNKTSAYPTLELVIYFKTSSTDLTSAQIKMFAGEEEITLETNDKSTSITTNTELMVKAEWSKICEAFTEANTDCLTAIASKALKIGFDKDAGGTLDEYLSLTLVTRNVLPDGVLFREYTDCATTESTKGHFCHFEVSAGDEKVYLDNLKYGDETFTSEVTGADYSQLVFFYEKNTTNDDQATLLSVKNNSPEAPVSINKSNTPPLEKFYLTGLSNNSRYCFVMANQDLTGNVSFFTNDDVFASQSATMCATPEEVFGALSGKQCFIATAAYGGPLAQEVETFRQFRDRFLLSSSLGQRFVKFYYNWSPPLAEMISESPTFKVITQFLLLPLLIVAKASLGWGLGKTFLVFLLGVFLLFGKNIFKFFSRTFSRAFLKVKNK